MKKLSFLIIVILLATLAPNVSAQDDPCAIRGGSPDPETGACTLNFSIEMKLAYPTEFAAYPFAQQAIDDFFKLTTDTFFNYAEPFYYSPAPWSLETRYQISPYSEDIVSLEIDIYEYTGGAHPNSYFKTFTFDLANEREITISDLFTSPEEGLAAVAPLAQAGIVAYLGEGADAQWILDGTGTDPYNYQSFVLAPDSLTLLFPPYQVAPYAAGPITVTIPLNQLADVWALDA